MSLLHRKASAVDGGALVGGVRRRRKAAPAAAARHCVRRSAKGPSHLKRCVKFAAVAKQSRKKRGGALIGGCGDCIGEMMGYGALYGGSKRSDMIQDYRTYHAKRGVDISYKQALVELKGLDFDPVSETVSPHVPAVKKAAKARAPRVSRESAIAKEIAAQVIAETSPALQRGLDQISKAVEKQPELAQLVAPAVAAAVEEGKALAAEGAAPLTIAVGTGLYGGRRRRASSSRAKLLKELHAASRHSGLCPPYEPKGEKYSDAKLMKLLKQLKKA